MQFFSISRRGRRGQNFLGTPQWVFYQPRKNCECARMCTFKNWVLVNSAFFDPTSLKSLFSLISPIIYFSAKQLWDSIVVYGDGNVAFFQALLLSAVPKKTMQSVFLVTSQTWDGHCSWFLSCVSYLDPILGSKKGSQKTTQPAKSRKICLDSE